MCMVSVYSVSRVKLVKDIKRFRAPDLWEALVIILFTIGLSALIIVDRYLSSFSAGPC